MEDAFGRKDTKLIQLIPTSKFRQQNIQPFPGLQLNIDGMFGTVKTVSGGRCLVDFNHPLSGKDLVYEVKLTRIVHDSKEKLAALLKIYLHAENPEVEVSGDTANITLKPSHHHHEHPKEPFMEAAKKLITEIKTINITEAEKKK